MSKPSALSLSLGLGVAAPFDQAAEELDPPRGELLLPTGMLQLLLARFDRVLGIVLLVLDGLLGVLYLVLQVVMHLNRVVFVWLTICPSSRSLL